MAHSAPQSRTPSGPRIVRVERRVLPAAVRRLVHDATSGVAPAEAARRFISAAESHGLDLSHFWASLNPAGAVAQVALAVPGAGRTATCFVSSPATPEDVAELSSVIGRACESLTGVRLAQALLEPHETGAREAFLGAGFMHLADLAYLRWARTAGAAPPAGEWPEGVGVANWREEDDADLCAGLERTYEGTLDCPGLCGLRETSDVLASHRAIGRFDPALWWIVRLNGAPEGAVLFNACPDQGTIELVYLGLSPALRGRGLGKRLLAMALAALGARREPTVTCAVDVRNTPAMRLYESFGFKSFARRCALVRALP